MSGFFETRMPPSGGIETLWSVVEIPGAQPWMDVKSRTNCNTDKYEAKCSGGRFRFRQVVERPDEWCTEDDEYHQPANDNEALHDFPSIPKSRGADWRYAKVS